MRTALSLILVLALAVSAAAQTVVSPIAHLSRADGTFYVGAGNGTIVAETGETARLSLGLGTIATQNANAIAITGGTIDWSQRLRGSVRATTARVTIMFDDNLENTYTDAYPLLSAQGEVACVSVPTDYIGEAGYMSAANLATLEGAGWEIVSHAKGSDLLTGMSVEDYTEQIEGSKTVLDGLGLTVESFVYPSHDSNQAIRNVTRGTYRAARGSFETAGPNAPVIDTFALISVLGTSYSVAQIEAYVDTANTNGTWLILYWHSIDATEKTKIDTVIDYIQGLGVPIVTMHDALDEIENVMEAGDYVGLNDGGARIERVYGNVYMVDGRLGIDVASPDSKLEVHGNIHLSVDGNMVTFGNDDATDYSIKWDGNDAVQTITAGDFVFSGGKLGLGTATPSAWMHLYANSDTTDPYLRIEDADSTAGSRNPRVQFFGYGSRICELSAVDQIGLQVLGSDGAADTTFKNDTGRVGLQESVPDYLLDVNGTFGFTPGTDATPIDNGDVTLDFPTATTLRIRGKNGDTVRNLTLPISDSTALVASDQNAGTDITADLEEETHASEHAVGGADTVFPADPNADKILKWDDDHGTLVWADDTDTTYSAGDGLDLTGTTFSTDLKSGGGLEIDSGELRLSTHEAAAAQAGSGATATLDFSANAIIKYTFDDIDGDTTFTFTDPPAGSRCLLVLIQDGDGGESVIWPAAETIYWAGGTAFAPDETASSRAVVTLVFDGTDYYCTGYDYATP